jgi:tRNA/rRNA methyltransferase
LDSGDRCIREHQGSGAVALLFGSEKRGLSNHDLSYCHWLLHIPTREANISMNLGQAVAVCLYELVRDGKAAHLKEKPGPASSAELDRITSLLLDALRSSGYVHPRSSAAADEKIRRMIRRLNLRAGDAEVWLGILRQIVWKLHSNEES